MSKVKKSISIVLALLMLIGVFTVAPITASAETYGDYGYDILRDNTVEITNYMGSSTELIIPSELDGYSVSCIGYKAFYDCTCLTSVTIPNSVTSIGMEAFYDCTSLTNVTIPDSVTSIEQSAFGYCTNLKSVSFGNGVASIGNSVFGFCASLTSITIPNSVTSIGMKAFHDCASLTNVTIPDSVTSIKWGMFNGCTSLTSVTISSSVTSIDTYRMFYGCASLTNITIPDSVKSIEMEAFYNCTSLTNVTIPDSVKSIEMEAFRGCESLTSIIIPDSVTSIGQRAFWGCISLTNVTIPNSVMSISYQVFEECKELKDVYYLGNESQWNAIDNKSKLLNATIHFIEGLPTKLQPVSDSDSVVITTDNNKTKKIDIELVKDLKFKVSSDVPIIGGGEVKVDLSFVPISAKVEGDKLYVGIGVTDLTNDDVDKDTWCSFKNYVNGYKEKISKGKKLLEESKSGIASAGFGGDLNVDFFGYYEATIKDGKLIPSGGRANLKIDGSVKNEWQAAIGFVPVVLKIKGSIGADDKLTLSVSNKKVNFQNELKLTLPKITASAGVGVAYVADVSVYGEGKNEVKINNNPQRITGTLFGEMGVSAKALMFSGKLPLLKYKDGWTYYDSTKESKSKTSAPKNSINNLTYKIDRSYIDSQSEWLSVSKTNNKSKKSLGTGSEFSADTLQKDIYNDAAPKIIGTEKNKIIVWVGDDKTRTSGNQTAVMYSTYDSSSNIWSEPQIVEDNGTADFYPDIATDGKNTYLAWVDTNKTFSENVSVEDMAKGCEIKIAKFNDNTKQFEGVKKLTNNETVDIKPSVALTDGKLSVVWKNSSDNNVNVHSGTDSIFAATEQPDGSFVSSEIYSSTNAIYEIVNCGNNVAFTADTDNDSDTSKDVEVFAYTSDTVKRLTDNDTVENNLRYSDINGKNFLTFEGGGAIFGTEDFDNINALTDENTQVYGAYQFVGDGSETRLYSVESVDESSEIFSYTLDSDNKWSGGIQLSNTKSYIRNPSFVMDNSGHIQSVYLKTSANITDDDVTESTDLCVSGMNDVHKIKINDYSYDSEEFAPGKDFKVDVNLSNTGTVNENGFKIIVKDENEEIVSEKTFDNAVGSGETKIVSVDIPISNGLDKLTNYEIIAQYLNESANDSKILPLGYTELQLITERATKDGVPGLAIYTKNDSVVSTDMDLVVRAGDKNGDILDTISLGEIQGKEELVFFLEKEKLEQYKVFVDTLYFELVASKDEEALANNESSVFISDSTDGYSSLEDPGPTDPTEPTEPTQATEPTVTQPTTQQPTTPAPKLNKTKASVKAGGTVTLKVTNGTVKTWSTSNKKVATVSKGKVTGLKKGSATITATLTTGKKLTCKVTVTTSPKLSKKSVTVKKGKTVSVKITGKAKTVKNVYTNTKFAKITSKNTATTIKVKGLKKGKTTLKVKVNGVVLKLKVKVK